MKTIAILGSTGSIGTQTLDVVRQHPSRFSVFMLSANNNAELLVQLSANNNAELLVQQALQFHVPHVVICNPDKFAQVKAALPGVQVHLGIDAACELVQAPEVDVVVAAMVGFSGLKPTLAAIRARKTPLRRLHISGRFGAFGHLPMPAGRAGKSRAPDSSHRFRRSVPHLAAGADCYRHQGAGTQASQLGYGGQNHHRLGYHDEQRLRGH